MGTDATARQPRAASRALWPAAPAQVHLVLPRPTNDAQQIAGKFKRAVPVILDLQGADVELSKRLIDFASGLTYASTVRCSGSPTRSSCSPRNVEVSAEERARLIAR